MQKAQYSVIIDMFDEWEDMDDFFDYLIPAFLFLINISWCYRTTTGGNGYGSDGGGGRGG